MKICFIKYKIILIEWKYIFTSYEFLFLQHFSNHKIVSSLFWMIFISNRCSASIKIGPVNLHNSADNIGNWRIEGKLLLFGVVRNSDTKPLLHFFGVVRTIFFTTFIWKIICRAAHLWTGLIVGFQANNAFYHFVCVFSYLSFNF